MIFLKKGWIENRRSEREKTTLLLTYRIIQLAMLSSVQHDANYSKTHVKGDLAPMTARLFGVTPEHLTEKGLLFCSQDPLQDGWWVELTLKVPKWEVPMKFLAQIGAVHTENEMREVIFAANLQLHSVNKADMQNLTDVIQGKR